MHGHRPYGMAHYYLGRYEDEQFYPEIHGRMNWQGGQLSGPETLFDDKGRRIFFRLDSRSSTVGEIWMGFRDDVAADPIAE